MKVKNELVSLKVGNKKYDFKNLILDEYLKRIVLSQIDNTTRRYIPYQLLLDTILLKFDTPLENLSQQSTVYLEDFDIAFALGCKTIITEISEKSISTKYTYNMSELIYNYNKKKGESFPSEDYYGKKITAIGFATNFSSLNKRNRVCAVLDTLNYNIYMQTNQKLECTRKDVITSDALFWSNDVRIKGPVHLCPDGGEPLLYQEPYAGFKEKDKLLFNAIPAERTKGVLYSVGLSSYSNYIDKEFVIGKDVEIVQNETELIVQSINNLYSFEKELHTNEAIYPFTNLYPVKSNYKYVIFKYKVYQELAEFVYETTSGGGYEYTQTDTGSYYYQAIPIDKFGKSNIKIKYERG